MNAYFRGQPIFGQRGPAGPDGNPIGTIISFMGRTAPRDYLVCDGSLYNVSDYPDLADFFEQQFGDKYYFGGENNKFAVPDMRNLFLRGYHGEADETLSGDVGEKQEGTTYPYIGTFNGQILFGYGISTFPNQLDSSSAAIGNRSWMKQTDGDTATYPLSYTSRPVNMAVLYCIKAVKSEYEKREDG